MVERLKARRRHRRRQDQHARVRRRRQHLQRGLRRHPQPVEPRAHLRRLERRRGGGAGHRHGPARPGLGSRRLAAHARRVLRRRRLPDLARACVPACTRRDLGWDTLRVTGPMARTVGDTALMLAAMAGPDDRAPALLRRSTPRQFTAAVKRPSVKGWRVAWTPRPERAHPGGPRGGRASPRARSRVFRALGAKRRARLPGLHRGQRHRAGHPRALAWWRATPTSCAQWNGRCRRGSCGTSSRGSRSRRRASAAARVSRTRPLAAGARLHGALRPPDPAHRRRCRRSRWSRRYPTEINGKPLDNYTQWFFLTYGITLTAPARHLGAVRLHRERAAGGAADRRAPASGGGGAAGPPRSRRPRPGRTTGLSKMGGPGTPPIPPAFGAPRRSRAAPGPWTRRRAVGGRLDELELHEVLGRLTRLRLRPIRARIDVGVVVAELEVARIRPGHAEPDGIRVDEPLASFLPAGTPRHDVNLIDEGVAPARLDLDDHGLDEAVGRRHAEDLLVAPAPRRAEQHAREHDRPPPAHRVGKMRMRPSTAGAMVPAVATACSSTSAASGPLSASTIIWPSRNAVIPSPPLAT